MPTVTGKVATESQPRLLVSVTVTSWFPGEFQFTWMLLPLAAPTMVPPVTVQAFVFREKFWSAYLVVVCVQADGRPRRKGTGVGLMTMLRLTVESQPEPLVAVRVIFPLAPVPQVTWMFVPVFEVTVPPDTVQV